MLTPRTRSNSPSGRDRDRHEKFGGIDRADDLAGFAPLREEVGGDDGPPPAASRPVEGTADEAEAADEFEVAVGLRPPHAAPQEIDADRAQISENERPRDGGVRSEEHTSE